MSRPLRSSFFQNKKTSQRIYQEVSSELIKAVDEAFEAKILIESKDSNFKLHTF